MRLQRASKFFLLYDKVYFETYNNTFAKSLEKRGILPCQDFINYYDAILLAINLVNSYGNDVDNLKEHIKEYTFEGIGGTIYISEDGLVYRKISILTVNNSRFVTDRVINTERGRRHGKK